MNYWSATTTFVFIAVWGWMLVDVVLSDRRFVRYGPKYCWVAFVGILPVLGWLAWLMFGRPPTAFRRDRSPVRRVAGPEDSAAWLSFIGK